MMLVHTDPVEAHLRGELELVHVFVVHAVPRRGVEEVARRIDPDAGVLGGEVGGQLLIGHQVEPVEAHHDLRYRPGTEWELV